MLRTLLAVVVTISLVAETSPGQTPVRRDGYSVVTVFIKSAEELATMLSISQDHWTENVGVGVMDFCVSPAGLRALAATGIPFEVVVADVQLLIDAETARLAQMGPGGGFFDDFKTYDQINAQLDVLANMHPELAQTFTIGTSLEGRVIRGIRITGPGSNKPAIFLNGCQHAREWISPMTNLCIASRLVDDYALDPAVQAVVDDIEWLIVPIVNPDGYVYSWGPDRMWRKNRRDNGDGTTGVDLNRNWDFAWGGGGSSGNGASQTYRGPAPFSEPETQALRDFYVANPQIIANIDFHSYSQLILAPWGWTSSPPADDALFDQVGGTMASTILDVFGEVYVHGPINPTLYLADGVSVDWAYGDQDVFSWTIELRPATANPGFILPPQQIIPTCQENFEAMLDLAAFATQGPQFIFPAGLPVLVVADTPTSIAVEIGAVVAAVMPDSGVLKTRIGGIGGWLSSPLTDLGGGGYQATLPPVPCGETIEFYFEVQTDDGLTHTSPGDAPASPYAADAADVQTLFAEDFETDTGWTVDDSPLLTDGTWERGVPINCDRGDPPADFDGSGQCYLTANDAVNGCNSDVDAGDTTLTSPIMDASDPAAVIEYARWYSTNTGGDPNSDTMDVEVSDDGGATWLGLETVGPGGPEVGGGWILKSFVIADVPGLANTDVFVIRFTVSDPGTGSIVEAAIDAVALQTFGCSKGIFGDLDGDGSVGIGDLLTLLAAWGPCPAPPAMCPSDLNGDGSTGIADLLALLANWG